MAKEQAGLQGTARVAPPRYRIDSGHSRLTVQAFAGGLLSFAGHSPTFAVRHYEGELRWQPDTFEGSGLEVTIRADSLELMDAARPADRAEIEGRMRGKVLQTPSFPDIRFQGPAIATAAVADNRYRLRLAGLLSLRGVTNRQPFEAELLRYSDGVRLVGEFPLWLSDYRIPPVTALRGAIRLRDQLRVSFDVVAWKEAS
jgi:polyisoprenoid-binding protein YceI